MPIDCLRDLIYTSEEDNTTDTSMACVPLPNPHMNHHLDIMRYPQMIQKPKNQSNPGLSFPAPSSEYVREKFVMVSIPDSQ